MSDFELCLLDCQSIQQYVFGSNKLRTNIGASENVAAIFDETLKKTLPPNHDITSWSNAPDTIKIFTSGGPEVEAGYIGGGNALLIFKKNGSDSPAKYFVRKWSRQVLLDFPGIVPAAIVSDSFSAKEEMSKNINSLFKRFSAEKNKGIPQTTLPRHGITAECKITGLSAEEFDRDKNAKAWTSSVNISKTLAAKKYISSEHSKPEKVFEKSGKSSYRYTFTEEKLGQTEAHNHIAVVHIDGNSMGKQFQGCRDLSVRRKLSVAVARRTEDAWESIALALLARMPELIKDKIVKPEKSDDHLDLLPLRKLILNGDDLTFICNAQLAFWLTELFLKALADEPLKINDEILKDAHKNEIRMSACAGIAVVKTKFPFYRAYQLAEELCGEAKKKGREKKESWIDFEIVYGGLSGDLEQIRKKKYSIGNKTLISRPWRVLDEDGKVADVLPQDWKCMKTALKDFLRQDKDGKEVWPRSKRKELLQRMTRGVTGLKDYETILTARGLKLPPVCGHNVDDDIRLPFYYDALQAGEFYPTLLLEGKE